MARDQEARLKAGNRNGSERGKGKGSGSRRGAQHGDYQLSFGDYMMLTALAEALMKSGGALRIGMTRDGGALALGIYMGDDYGTEYVRPDEMLEDALHDIAAAWLESKADAYAFALEDRYKGLEAFVKASQKTTTIERKQG